MCAHLCKGNLNIAIESKIQFHAKFLPAKLKIFAPKQNWSFMMIELKIEIFLMRLAMTYF